MTRIFSRAFRVLLPCGFALAALHSPARADEFSPVPTSDAAYAQLQILAPTGWIESRVGARRVVLTRYEIATETARAILALQAQQSKKPRSPLVARGVVRALRELVVGFRPELRALGIDAAAGLRLCDELLQAENAPAVSPIVPPRIAPPETSATQNPATARTEILTPNFVRQNDFAPPNTSIALNRLRLDSLVSALSRDALDPFGDTDDAFSPRAKLPRGGVALGLADGISLRANGADFRPNGQQISPFNAPYRARGGAVDVDVRGVRLTGAVEQMSPLFAGENTTSWNRVGGALGFSAWRNRLTMRANWSRLLPTDARLVPASVGGLDVGLDISERLRLTLLYQQMFNGRIENAADRVVSTGININF